jgi:hypothetical protein
VVELLLLWAAMHVVKATMSRPASNRPRRRRPLILTGWMVYAITLFPGFRHPAADALGLGSARFLRSRADRGRGARAGARPAVPAERGTAFNWFTCSWEPRRFRPVCCWEDSGRLRRQIAFLVSSGLAFLATAGFWR